MAITGDKLIAARPLLKEEWQLVLDCILALADEDDGRIEYPDLAEWLTGRGLARHQSDEPRAQRAR